MDNELIHLTHIDVWPYILIQSLAMTLLLTTCGLIFHVTRTRVGVIVYTIFSITTSIIAATIIAHITHINDPDYYSSISMAKDIRL